VKRDYDVQNGIHFISALPRAGSTLLAALLRQNPRFHAGMTSPVGSLFSALLRQMSQENETAVFIDDDQRARLLRACFEAYYADVHQEKLVFDTNRMWTSKLPALVELFPDLRMICCVRNPAWIIDSVERLTQRNKFEPSKIFNFDPGGTVYSRADGLSSGSGMFGFALNALREAFRSAVTRALRDADRKSARYARGNLRLYQRAAVSPRHRAHRTRLRGDGV
jgi:sulfotransferase